MSPLALFTLSSGPMDHCYLHRNLREIFEMGFLLTLWTFSPTFCCVFGTVSEAEIFLMWTETKEEEKPDNGLNYSTCSTELPKMKKEI